MPNRSSRFWTDTRAAFWAGLRAGGIALVVLAATCGQKGPGVSGLVDHSDGSADHLSATYLGTGGWIFEYGGEQVLTAPLFSNPGFIRTGLWRIEQDEDLVDRYMSRYDVRDARAILVGHAHYDHLMDVPRVAEAHATSARIVGSRTVANTLGMWSGVAHLVDVVNDSAGTVEEMGRWLTYGPRVRVLPLRSKHAPHFDGYTLYEGHYTRPLARMPVNAAEWVDGDTFAYLIDFLDPDGEVAFRIFYQDAVVAPPYGEAPVSLMEERPVDVAVMVPSTFDQVDWHPEALVLNLRPEYILLGHWEDFFVPIEAETRSVRMTDLDHFEWRLSRVYDGDVWRPELWTEFRIPRSR